MAGDLPRLSDVERQVLALLATGHTAKSIAAVTGLSVNAVNERLRLARRKTGVGSSRELARKVGQGGGTAQEIRHKQIALADLPASGEAPGHRRAAAPRALLVKGSFAMSMLALAVAAAVAVTASGGHEQPVADGPADQPRVVATSPVAGAVIAPGPFTLSVTFDQPMRRDSYSFVTTDLAPYPECERSPRQSDNGRTFTLRCVGKSGQGYAVGFNHGRFRNFVSRAGHVPAAPAVLAFRVR